MVAAQKTNDLLRAQERINKLLDSSSFVEQSAHFLNAEVVSGYGSIDSRLVYVYSQYGPLNIPQAKKICMTYAAALKMGAPVIGILDSSGLYLHDGIDAAEAYGIIFTVMSEASGVIPQLSVITGDCMGLSAFIPNLSDFVFMTNNKNRLFNESPNTYSDSLTAANENAGSANYHYEKTGMVHFLHETEDETMANVKKLFDFLPSNNLEEPNMIIQNDDINRTDDNLNSISSNKEIDSYEVIRTIVDNGSFMEINKGFAKNVITCFGRFNGNAVAIVANNGLITGDALKKCAAFVCFCDAYNIPILNLTNVSGYESSAKNDNEILYFGSKLMNAYANATVAKINIVLKQAVGSPYLMMNSKHLGADVTYAWENSEIALMEKGTAGKVVGINLDSSAMRAAEKGYVDEIIKPETTRKCIIVSLEMLFTKRVIKHGKKHNSILL